MNEVFVRLNSDGASGTSKTAPFPSILVMPETERVCVVKREDEVSEMRGEDWRVREMDVMVTLMSVRVPEDVTMRSEEVEVDSGIERVIAMIVRAPVLTVNAGETATKEELYRNVGGVEYAERL